MGSWVITVSSTVMGRTALEVDALDGVVAGRSTNPRVADRRDLGELVPPWSVGSLVCTAVRSGGDDLEVLEAHLGDAPVEAVLLIEPPGGLTWRPANKSDKRDVDGTWLPAIAVILRSHVCCDPGAIQVYCEPSRTSPSMPMKLIHAAVTGRAMKTGS